MRKAALEICTRMGLTLHEKVGEGSFKETFRAKRGEDDVALKILRPGAMSDARTEREIEAMTRCNHPNVARLLSIDRVLVDGQEFVCLLEEYLGGGTLKSRLVDGPLSREELGQLLREMASGIAHVASHDLVHRDIKPDNILFRPDGSPVIVDFGIVRDLGRSPLTRTWILQGPGTPFYASPEQLNNERHLIDWRVDQFSLAVTLFIARFQNHPWDEGAEAPDAVVGKVAHRMPLPTGAIALAEEDGLAPLLRSLSPWPVGRYRLPRDFMDMAGRL